MKEYINWIQDRIDRKIRYIKELESTTGLTYTEGEYRDRELSRERSELSILTQCKDKIIEIESLKFPSESDIDEFLEEYEMRGEKEDGRDARYVPTDEEKVLIKDAIISFLSDKI